MAKESENYHHGDLREAILRCAEEVLKREGPSTISLRACAREIGVSHAAPAHHFPNLASLLTALAVIGFERLVVALRDAMSKEGCSPIDVGMAYVEFACDNKELFHLMNSPSRLNSQDAELQAARRRAYEALGTVASVPLENPSLEIVGGLAGRWAICHGLAVLLLGGRLTGFVKMAPEGTTEMDIVKAAFLAMSRR